MMTSATLPIAVRRLNKPRRRATGRPTISAPFNIPTLSEWKMAKLIFSCRLIRRTLAVRVTSAMASEIANTHESIPKGTAETFTCPTSVVVKMFSLFAFVLNSVSGLSPNG